MRKSFYIKETITQEDKAKSSEILDIHLDDDLPRALVAILHKINTLEDVAERQSKVVNIEGMRAEQQNEYIDERTQKWINKYSPYKKNDHPLNPYISEAASLLNGWRQLVLTLESVIESYSSLYVYTKGYVETERYASINEIKKNIAIMEKELEEIKLESSKDDKSIVRDKTQKNEIKPDFKQKPDNYSILLMVQDKLDDMHGKAVGSRVLSDLCGVSTVQMDGMLKPFVDSGVLKSWILNKKPIYKFNHGKRLVDEQPS